MLYFIFLCIILTSYQMIDIKSITIKQSNSMLFDMEHSKEKALSTCSLSYPSMIRRILNIHGGKSEKVIEVMNINELDDILNSNESKLVVIDFTAVWCGPCRAIAPVYDQLSIDYADDVVFLKVDVDQASDISQKYNVMSMPTFIFIRNKEVVDRFSGASVEKLSNTINSLI